MRRMGPRPRKNWCLDAVPYLGRLHGHKVDLETVLRLLRLDAHQPDSKPGEEIDGKVLISRTYFDDPSLICHRGSVALY